MKKKVLLAMAIVMVLGSIKAMALTDDEVMEMNAATKVEAAMIQSLEQSGAEREVSDEDGKIMATQLTEIQQVVSEVKALMASASSEDVTGLQTRSAENIREKVERMGSLAETTMDPTVVNQLYKEAIQLKQQLGL